MNEKIEKLVETIEIVRTRFERDLRWMDEYARENPDETLESLLQQLFRIYTHYFKLNTTIKRVAEEVYAEKTKRQ